MQVTALNWLDYAILGVMTLSVIIGLFRGFVREALSLAFWVVAFWVSFTFADEVAAHYLVNYIDAPAPRMILSFVILFGATLLIGAIIAALLGKIIDKTGLSGTDRLLGLAFGAARGAVFVALFLMVSQIAHFEEHEAWQKSVLVPHFQPIVVWLKGFLPSEFTEPSDEAKSEKPDEKTELLKPAKEAEGKN